MLKSSVFLSVAGASAALASFSLQETYDDSNWWNKFNFFSGPDPTNGYVDYVNQQVACDTGLITSTSKASWAVDSTTVMSASNSTGRASIRLSSKSTYTHGLFIADIAHMPSSTCGLWPAYWFLGQTGTWPQSGELDIIENANNVNKNQISGHSTAGCSITNSVQQSGNILGTKCAVSDGTSGCTAEDTRSQSYGDGFNKNNGGIYAMNWNSSGIWVWFFPRGSIPSSVTSGSPSPDGDFGEPTSVFTGSGCDWDSKFYNHAIIFDTTFCGDWAGVTFANTCSSVSSGSYGNSQDACKAYVAQNPSAFSEAYWTVNSIKVYGSDSSNSTSAIGYGASSASSTTQAVGAASVASSVYSSAGTAPATLVSSYGTGASAVDAASATGTPSRSQWGRGHGNHHWTKRTRLLHHRRSMPTPFVESF